MNPRKPEEKGHVENVQSFSKRLSDKELIQAWGVSDEELDCYKQEHSEVVASYCFRKNPEVETNEE